MSGEEFGKLDGFYPGSLTPVRDYGQRDTAELVIPEDGRMELGKPCKVEGDAEYFKIGALAAALNRKPVTIRLMESRGDLPPARWGGDSVQGNGTPRLYSRQQIEDTVRIAHEEGILQQTWRPVKETRFRERVQEIW